ncbi:hypothetical protein LTR16_011796, partial [Cryomyces antarcticus]
RQQLLRTSRWAVRRRRSSISALTTRRTLYLPGLRLPSPLRAYLYSMICLRSQNNLWRRPKMALRWNRYSQKMRSASCSSQSNIT